MVPSLSCIRQVPAVTDNAVNRKKHVLQWHILHRCNLRCTHCYQDDYASELSADTLSGFLSQCIEFCDTHGFRGHINFTGGEPLLSDALFPLMDKCDKYRITYGLLTNGTLIDADIAGRLAAHKGIRFVQVSIDGTKETHDRVRGKGNFDKAFRGLHYLRDAGIQTMAAFTCHKGNYRELGKVIKAVRKNGIDRFWADRLIPMGSSKEDVLSTEEYREVIKLLTKEHSRRTLFSHTDVHLNRSLQFLEGGNCYYYCDAGISLLTLLADGTLMPCRRLPLALGSCLEKSMSEIYDNSDIIRQLKETTIPEECNSCPKAHLCMGGAKCLSYAMTGDYNRKDINCYYK